MPLDAALRGMLLGETGDGGACERRPGRRGNGQAGPDGAACAGRTTGLGPGGTGEEGAGPPQSAVAAGSAHGGVGGGVGGGGGVGSRTGSGSGSGGGGAAFLGGIRPDGRRRD